MNLSDYANNSDLLQQQYWKQLDLQQLDDKHAAEVKDTIEAIFSLTAAHREKAASIRGDGDLSEAGRTSRLVALIGQSDAAVDKIAGPLAATLEKKTLAAARAIDNAVSVEPSVTDVMRMVEVRSICQSSDPLILKTLVLELADSGRDDLTVRAILTSPAIMPLIDDDTAVRVRALMGARVVPDQSIELEQSRDTLALLQNAIASAKRAFSTPTERATFGMADDPISRAALGLGREMVGADVAATAPGA